jgi:hypothetical protein
MKIISLIFGITAILLGGLWLLQGLGLVHVRPILCFADCAAIQGASATWAIIGGVTLGIGGLAIFWSRKASQRGRQKS